MLIGSFLHNLLPLLITVTGIHAQAQFFLLGILVVVLLDGPGPIAGHFSDVDDRSAGIEFAGNKRASCRLPRQLRHLILQEYLSGFRTARQLAEEHGIPMAAIHKMGQRWKAKNSCTFVSTPTPFPIMSRVTSEEASELLS